MDLSKVPIEVLRAEVKAVDAMTSATDFADKITPLCRTFSSCYDDDNPCPLSEGECDGLRCQIGPGWPERKEQYLQRIRAEIESRITFIPNSDSQEVITR